MFTAAAEYYSQGNRLINTVDDFLQQMSRTWDTARNALLLAQTNQKRAYDTHHRHDEFYVGDYVYMSTKRHYDYGKIQYSSQAANLADSEKFQPRYLGPFRIIGKPSAHAYELELPPSIKIHPVIHIRYLLRPREAKRFPNYRIEDYRKPPEIIDGHLEFEVESILKRRIRKYGRGFRTEYLVHWKGYPSEDDTWEPLSNLTNCTDLLRAYHNSVDINALIEVNCLFIL